MRNTHETLSYAFAMSTFIIKFQPLNFFCMFRTSSCARSTLLAIDQPLMKALCYEEMILLRILSRRQASNLDTILFKKLHKFMGQNIENVDRDDVFGISVTSVKMNPYGNSTPAKKSCTASTTSGPTTSQAAMKNRPVNPSRLGAASPSIWKTTC